MAALRLKITKRAVDAARIPIVGEARIWDTEVRGFVLRSIQAGEKCTRSNAGLAGDSTFTPLAFTARPGHPIKPERRRLRPFGGPRMARTRARQKKPLEKPSRSEASLIDTSRTAPPRSSPSARALGKSTRRTSTGMFAILGGKVVNAVAKADATRTVRDIALGKTATDERQGRAGERALPAEKQLHGAPQRSLPPCLPGASNMG